MKINKLLWLGTIVAVAAPVVVVVSCDDNNDNKPVGNKTIEIKQTTVEPHIQVNTINKITQGTLMVSEIDKVHHTLLIEDYKKDQRFSGSGLGSGVGLTTIQGTKEMYETFGLDGTDNERKK